MIRIALVAWAEDDWRIFRQEQWMGEVRRDPSVADRPRMHFDIGEDAYRAVVEAWAREGHGTSRRSATERLARAGAVEVTPR